MQDIQAEMQTRVRRGGLEADRTTGNMVWGEFVHTTSRPVDGKPDPHLHMHCFVFNCTLDQVEQRWKAGQFAGVKRDAPYFEALFHARLARRLGELGLAVERVGKSWELAGVTRATLEKFSRRTAEIEQEAKRLGLEHAKDRDGLGARTRSHKGPTLAPERLRQEWWSRLTPEETADVARVAASIGSTQIPEHSGAADEIARQSLEHILERNSVTPERALMTDALRRGLGRVSATRITDAVKKLNVIRADRSGESFVTTAEVLDEEKRMLRFAREGRGTCSPLCERYSFTYGQLSESQRKAAVQVLQSNDRVILLRGAAGTGKTTMMKEVVAAIESTGTRVFAFAPSAQASRGVLRGDGFRDADTVARLCVDASIQNQARGQVLWIDEAGLLGTRQMADLFELASRLEARILLTGDRYQHGSVARGAALRLLETEAGLVPAELREIRRQKGDYRRAVEALSKGRVQEGFRQLDALGFVQEVPSEERYKLLAQKYLSARKRGKSVLVVSPTHAEGQRITDEIRRGLKLSGKERLVATLESLDLTAADRRDATKYQSGDVFIFTQNKGEYRKGQRLTVGRDAVPFALAEHFGVYRPKPLALKVGDLIRITRGTRAVGNKRLDNGDMLTVSGFRRDGSVIVRKPGLLAWPKVLAPENLFLTHGYVVTSHASQGKTVDEVLIGQSSASGGAASPEQFYVSVSRGKESVMIFTDSKSELLDSISRAQERVSATELVNTSERLRYLAAQRAREEMVLQGSWVDKFPRREPELSRE